MKWMTFFFWSFFGVVFYAFLGYGIVLYLIVKLNKIFGRQQNTVDSAFEPPVTIVIPCFNEAEVIADKIVNTLSLNYPREKLKIIVIADGSTDDTNLVVKNFQGIEYLHQARRAGKTAAENRVMNFVQTAFVIFTDANTMLNTGAVNNIVKHFANDNVGCVSGEKKIITEATDSASASGEGIYWKYESLLKKLDSELNSAVGAAGELVAFRTSLYKQLPEDTLLDDFMQSMQMAARGYKIVYEPGAYAIETASTNVKEELKRKIRISTGGWQSIVRLASLLTPRKTPLLFFQYVSHRVLRWTITPFLLVAMFILNVIICFEGTSLYIFIMMLQVVFYTAALLGNILENRKVRFKPLFVPYYFCMMNYAVLAGFKNYISGKQNGLWEKAQRKVVLSK
jgi:biofilm PGA synthesis N-glycosyltransferase PgaC